MIPRSLLRDNLGFSLSSVLSQQRIRQRTALEQPLLLCVHCCHMEPQPFPVEELPCSVKGTVGNSQHKLLALVFGRMDTSCNIFIIRMWHV